MSEPISSLLLRLGKPPSDLSDHLLVRFQVICQQQSHIGQPVRKLSLDEWFVTSDGELYYLPPAESRNVNGTENAVPTIAELTSEFRRRLQMPDVDEVQPVVSVPVIGTAIASDEKGVNRISGADLESPSSAVRVGKAPRKVNSSSVAKFRIGNETVHEAGGEVAQYSESETKRREQIIDLFTDSLTERFGDVIVEQEPVEIEPARSTKSLVIHSDRPFNWNLLIGAVLTTVVAGLVYAGMRVAESREARIASKTSKNSVDKTSVTSSQNSPDDEIRQPVSTEQTVRQRPVLSPNAIRPVTSSSGSIFNDDRESLLAEDPLETLESIENAQPLLPAEIEVGQLGIDVSPESLLKAEMNGDLNETQVTNAFGFEQESTSIETDMKEFGGEALTEALSKDRKPIEETMREIRPGKERFVQLRSPSSDRTTLLPILNRELASVEFPINTDIELVRGNPIRLVDADKKRAIATLSRNPKGYLFDWSAEAAKTPVSSRLYHGRLKDVVGQHVYLRPSIETDAYRLDLSSGNVHPSWKLGFPILPGKTKLDVQLRTPKLMEFGWIKKFDGNNPKRGNAVAVLTPPDRESVAVAVELLVRCDRELSCRLRYAGRLGPDRPWETISRQGVESAARNLKTKTSVLENRRANFDLMYAQGDAVQRKLMQRQREEIERQEEELKALIEKMAVMRAFIDTIESSVMLNFHLFVDWPDGQQTILRTANTSG